MPENTLWKIPGVARARPSGERRIAMIESLLLGAAIMAIRDLTISERQHAAIAEARKLADSGAYHDYTDIEYVLRFDQGLSDVTALLDSQAIHRDLNRRCADAREKQGRSEQIIFSLTVRHIRNWRVSKVVFLLGTE